MMLHNMAIYDQKLIYERESGAALLTVEEIEMFALNVGNGVEISQP